MTAFRGLTALPRPRQVSLFDYEAVGAVKPMSCLSRIFPRRVLLHPLADEDAAGKNAHPPWSTMKPWGPSSPFPVFPAFFPAASSFTPWLRRTRREKMRTLL